MSKIKKPNYKTPDASKYLMQQNAKFQNAKLQNDQCYLTPNSTKRKITKRPMLKKIQILYEKRQ